MNRVIHWICYTVSTLILIALAGLLTIQRSLSNFSDDISELGGIICALLMAFEIALFFGIEAVKRKVLPKSLQKFGAGATRCLRSYHAPVGAMACSILLFHILLSWNMSNFLHVEYITGYACTAFLILSIVSGVVYKLNRKLMTLLHILFSFAAVVPFVLHIAD